MEFLDAANGKSVGSLVFIHTTTLGRGNPATMAQRELERVPLPTDPEGFDSDDRISFSRLENKFIAVQDDGTELEFDTQLRRWVLPTLDEDLLREQQRAYMVPGAEDAEEEAPNPKKRKKGGPNGSEVGRQRPSPSRASS